MKLKLAILIIGFFVVTFAYAALPKEGINLQEITSSTPTKDLDFLNRPDLIKSLGWTKNGSDFLCGGCYVDNDNIVNNPNPPAISEAPINVKASKPAFFTEEGTSVIQGDVKFIQPGREITADHVTFYRDSKTNKINKSVLLGHVIFREPGKLIVAEQGQLDFVNKVYIFHNGAYRLIENIPTGLKSIWGRAKTAISRAKGVLNLSKASYTTCPPDAVPWYLRGSQVTLDRNTGRGEVVNATIYFKQVPIFYAPYYNFAIDKRRKSGFLTPWPTHSSGSGFGISFPYYFNLAPNYDATFTPELYSSRGILFDGLFRYLTKSSNGSAKVSYIPHDNAFVKYRNSKADPSLYPGKSHAFQSLKDSSDSRGLVSLQNELIFDQHWKGSLRANYVSDDYFLEDFSNVNPGVENDQLLNQADLSYADDHWNLLGRLQVFQTLHPITHNNVRDQYKRLPQISLSGDFPDGWKNLDYKLDTEIVNFMHRDDFYGTNSYQITSGSRFNLRPGVSMPINWLGGYLIPRIQLQTTGYNIHDQVKSSTPDNILRFYPIVSVDGGMFLQRDINFFYQKYTQTLEPRVFYLLVPERGQGFLPIFDTYLPAFDFDQLFRTNRFTGIDRVGDANQISLGLTTRFLNEEGQEKLNASIGEIFVMHKHRVVINQNDTGIINYNFDPLQNEILSPLVGRLQYNIYSKMSTSLDLAWDPNYHRMNTLKANLQYLNDSEHVVNFWYQYGLLADQDPGTTNKKIDLSRIGLSTGWKIWRGWNFIGSLNYNIGYKRAQNYLYGIEYNSCCWAFRVVHSQEFTGIGVDKTKNYDSRIYLQFLLKGMGALDSGGLDGVLASQISGYRNKLVAGV